MFSLLTLFFIFPVVLSFCIIGGVIYLLVMYWQEILLWLAGFALLAAIAFAILVFP
jgi:hypothetical protein